VLQRVVNALEKDERHGTTHWWILSSRKFGIILSTILKYCYSPLQTVTKYHRGPRAWTKQWRGDIFMVHSTVQYALGSIIGRKYLDQLSNYQLLKWNWDPWNYLVISYTVISYGLTHKSIYIFLAVVNNEYDH
jgi:hypothetical protein